MSDSPLIHLIDQMAPTLQAAGFCIGGIATIYIAYIGKQIKDQGNTIVKQGEHAGKRLDQVAVDAKAGADLTAQGNEAIADLHATVNGNTVAATAAALESARLREVHAGEAATLRAEKSAAAHVMELLEREREKNEATARELADLRQQLAVATAPVIGPVPVIVTNSESQPIPIVVEPNETPEKVEPRA